MKKRFFPVFLVAMLLLCTQVQAQFAYSFSTYTQPYVPLAQDPGMVAAFDSGRLWRGDTSYFVINMDTPVCKLDTIPCPFIFFMHANSLTTDPFQPAVSSGFYFSEANFIDRGVIGGTSLSSIYAAGDDAGGEYVFKFEVYNAGFLNEYNSLHTVDDSVCVQIWIYQSTNDVEIHYGPSHITHPELYFTNGMGPGVYYMQDNGTPAGAVYALAGSPSNPAIQPGVLVGDTTATSPARLNAWPADGTVYLFSHNKLSVPTVQQAGSIKVYPTYAHDEVIATADRTEHAAYNVVSINGAATGITGQLNNGNTHIDINTLPQGMYLLVVQDGETKSVHKFVKI